MSQVQVKSSDIIKLILQFFKETNLKQSFDTLQRESKITLNTTNIKQFVANIKSKKWDQLLLMLNSLMLNEEHLFSLYQLVLDDLIESDRFQAAQHIIKNWIKKDIRNIANYRERLLRVEYIIQNPQEKALHKKIVTQHRENEVIKQCLHDIHEDIQPHRLVKLLTQAIKYQSYEGTIKPNIRLNLFQGKQKVIQQQQQTIIKNIQKVIKYPEDAKISSIALSCGQQYLSLGGFDGLIEIYNTIDYSYHNGLKFQSEGIALFHDHPVTIMQFNPSDDMLASADSKGLIKIWNLQTGKLLRKIDGQKGVGSLAWGMDPSHLLSAFLDIKLYGIRSCTVLKDYSMSTQNDYINKILVSESRIYSVTNGGIVKIFNYNTQEQVISTKLGQTVVAVTPIFQSRGNYVIDRLLIATTQKVYELNRGGEQENRYQIQVGELHNIACVGEYVYEFVTLDQKTLKMNVRSRSSNKTVYFCTIEGQSQLCAMQRRKNLLITYDDRCNLNFWRQPN